MKSLILKSLIAFSLIFFSAKSFASEDNDTTPSVTINGPSSAETGTTFTYTVTTQNINVTSATWSIAGTGTGNIITQDNTSATVYWTGVGNAKLDYTVTSANPAITGTVRDILNVTITGAVAPSAPTAPSVENIGCNTADLVSGGVPPTNVQWYWQGTNINGMSTANPAYADYPVTSSGTYYIRAMNVNTNLWSFSSTSISVTLSTPTWYEDTDGDGLGDPNPFNSVTSCTQPAGYVSNDLDQCPTVHGQGSATGCLVPVALSNENYVYSITPKVRVTDLNQLSADQDALRNVTYFDGRGRKMQSVAIRQSPNQKDIVAYFEYDPAGREAKTYLPYQAIDNNGSIKVDPKDALMQHYQIHYGDDFVGSYADDINPYSEVAFEEHALSRPVLQAAPGHDWKLGNGHEVKMEYALNTSYDAVKLFDVTLDSNFNPTLSLGIGLQTTYADGKLIKTIVKDENWTLTDGVNKTTEEFKNMNGQVVLKRNYDNGQAHDTYYVYDDFGNLSFVLPPKASDLTISSTVLDELCYQYKYDHRNRIIEKKIPGKGWEYIVYDKLDRPVLVQDAVQRLSNKWLYTKYDKLGRVAYSGEYTNTTITGQASMQSTFDSNNDIASELYENKVGSQSNLNINYENDNFPKTNVEVFTVNYYDTYYELPTGFTPPTSVYGQTISTNTQGLATVSKVRVLGTNDWITSFTYYDEKNRPVYIYSKNDYLQTTDIVETHLDFTGKVLETTTTHQKQGFNDLITVDRFEYDPQDRLVSQTQKVNNQTPERIVKNNYDELGQLTSKLTGSGTEKGYTDDTSGISISDDEITKTTGSCWSQGLASLGSFDEDGYVEFTTKGINKYYAVGLSSNNTNSTISSIQYAIYIRYADEVYIYESGTSLGVLDRYTPGDVFRVERVGNTIHYKRNNVTFYTSNIPSSGKLIADVSMCHDGGIIKDLHVVDNSKGLQNVDFDYNVRGWMTDINDVDAVNSDLFTFKINYNKAILGTGGGDPLFNGNISQIMWKTANTTTEKRGYSFEYDALNRLKTAYSRKGNTLSSTDRFSMWSNYDKNGNLTRLYRNGAIVTSPDVNTSSHYGSMDDLFYTYSANSNQLTKVADTGEDQYGFKDGTNTGDDYTYDANGNMKTDANKGITGINYNHLNLPTRVFFNGSQYIDYKYDAAGTKLEKRVVDNSNVTTTYYAGNQVYEKVGSSATELQFFSHPEGYVSHDNGTFDYVYQYKDHLGNVRLSYADSNNDGSITASTEIIEESNYYPYGLKHKGYNDVISSNGNSTAQKFKYNGIELEESLGLNLYEMDVRMYDPSIARFNGIDPVTHHSQGTSVAFDNNPVYWADPSGANSSQGAESWFSELQEGKNRVFDSSPIYDIEGNFLGTDDQGLQGEAIVMSKDDFKQGMSHQEAVSKNVGEEGMTSIYAILDKDSHFQSLKSRPDYDGIVTFSEAAKWMKNGGGDLFIDASKLDLSPIDTDYFEKGVGQSKSYDFFNGYKGLIENTNMALTFGEIWMTLEDKDGTVSLGPPSRNDGFLDSFDFKEKPKSTSKKGRDERNIGARIGREILGLKGSVDFYSYGKAKVKKK